MLTVAILTDLSRQNLFVATLRSLTWAGFPMVAVYRDQRRAGHAAAYLRALGALLPKTGDWLLLCEDDIAVPAGLGPYLQPLLDTLAPHRDGLAFATLFCSRGSRDWVAAHPVDGLRCFGRLIPNDCFAGTQCVLFPAASLQRLLPIMLDIHDRRPDWNGDRVLGAAAETAGLEAWCHRPSLVDHRGRFQSTLDSRADNAAMIAADYVGDDWLPTLPTNAICP